MQKIGPLYAPNGPTLEFEDRTDFIDLQRIHLEVKCKIVKADNTNLKYVTGDASQQDTQVFVNNTLHYSRIARPRSKSLFCKWTLRPQGLN